MEKLSMKWYSFYIKLILITWIINYTFSQSGDIYYLQIENTDQINILQSLPQTPIHLYISSEKIFNDEFLKTLKENIDYKNIGYLTINNMTIKAKHLSEFLEIFNEGFIKTLRFSNVKVIGSKKIKTANLCKNLEQLIITNCSIIQRFYEQLGKNGMPVLKHLEINSSKLDKKFIKILKEWNVITNLEFLDLSNNSIGNAIYNIFPLEETGNLQILKLNNCDVNFKQNHYMTQHNKLLSLAKDLKFTGINWMKPFFNHLKWLELQNAISDIDEILDVMKNEKFKTLNVFLGFLPVNSNESEYYKELFLIDYNAYLIKAFKLNLHSCKNNYYITHPEYLIKFSEYNQGKIAENIILSGKQWYDETVRAVLDLNLFPALKEITLTCVNLSESEFYQLIQDYPDYHFNITIFPDDESCVVHWPRFISGKKKKYSNFHEKFRR